MLMVERFLLPAGIDAAFRELIVTARCRERRGVASRIIKISPGESGWHRQHGSSVDAPIYLGEITRQCSQPKLPKGRPLPDY